jgi:hypothetical protein
MAIAMLLSSTVFADDVASLREELADLRAKMAVMETAQMAPAAGGDAESLISMKKKAAIKIGGSLDVYAYTVHRDTDPTANWDNDTNDLDGDGIVEGIPGGDVNNDGILEFREDDDINHTYFGFCPALTLEAKATEDTRVYFKLDLDDTATDGDLVEEAYFEWKHVAGSNWKIWLGKDEVEFGQDKSIGFFNTYAHGGADGCGDVFTGLPASSENSPANNHGWTPWNTFPGEVDNTFALQAAYTYKDLLVWSISVFQNEQGMYEDRSEDTLFFQSFASKLTVMPMEGFEAQVSLMRQHDESMDHEDSRGTMAALMASGLDRPAELNTAAEQSNFEDNYSNDQWAVSLGASWQPKGTSFEFWGEYLHGWDYGYHDDIDTDTVSLGMTWAVSESIDIGLMGEWANMDHDSTLHGQYDDVEYWNLYMTAYYTMNSNVRIGVEYLHQWFDAEGKYWDPVNNASRGIDWDTDADIIGVITSFSF